MINGGYTAAFDTVTVIFFQPVVKHAITTYPIVGELAAHGHRVIVSGPQALKVSLDHYLKKRNLADAYVFTASTVLKLLRVSMMKADLYILNPRVLAIKGGRRLNGFMVQAIYLLMLLRKIPIALELHHVSTFETQAPNSKTRGLSRMIERLLLKVFYRNVRMIIVFDEPIRDEVRKRTRTPLPVIVAPPALPGRHTTDRVAGELRVVMPGRISRRRKHYDWMTAIAPEDRHNIRLDFLGVSESNEDLQVLSLAKRLGFQGDFESGGRRIEADRFDALCEAADVFLANVEAQFGDKHLGKDTITAALLEAAEYRKPLLIPRDIPVGSSFLPALIQYDDQADLARRLTRLSHDRSELLRSTVPVALNSGDFTREIEDAVRCRQTWSA